MNNIFSLSFSNSNFQVLHLKNNENKTDLISKSIQEYPFTFNFDRLFTDENVKALSQIIRQKKDEAQIEDLSLMVSLPINYSLQKKIAMPVDVEQNIINEQVEWELSHYLPGQLSDFKVIMTDSSFEYSGYKEVLFICINKKILNYINIMAQLSDSTLSKLLVENFAIENYLLTNKLIDPVKNQILFNIDNIQLISHYFIGGKYFTSYTDNINPLKMNTYNEKVVRIAKEKYLVIKNLNEQLPFGKNKDLEVFVYGQALTELLLTDIQASFSDPVHKPHASNYPNLDSNEVSKYVEGLGIFC